MAELKHKNIIDSLFEKFYESWMDEDDKKEFQDLFFKVTETNFEEFDDMIETGVKNGVSADVQFSMMASIFASAMNGNDPKKTLISEIKNCKLGVN